MISLIKSKRKRTKSERRLWLATGLLASLCFFEFLSALRDGFPIELAQIGLWVIITGSTLLGILLSWGPLVPCSLLGWFVFLIFASPVSSSPVEAVINQFGIPLIGTVIGACIGLYYDWILLHPEDAATSEVSKTGDGDSDEKQSEKEHHEKT